MIRFGGSLITTRLLAPDLFGLVALAITLIIAMNMFADLGIRQVLVQQESVAEPKALESIWVLQIARGVVFAAILLVGAYVAHSLRATGTIAEGSVYGHPDFSIALLVLSVTPLLAGFESLRVHFASRELNLQRLTMIELASQCAALAFTISWALWSPDIYSVTLGIVLSGIVRTVLSHIWLSGRSDAFGWSTMHVKRVLRFSKWLFVSSALGFLAGYGDRLLLAGMLSPEDFGIFTVAGLLLGALQELGTRIIGNVIYPALSEIHRSEPAALSTGFFKFRSLFDAGIAAVAGLVIVIGPTVVEILYDDRYLQAGRVLQILAIILLFQWTSAAMYMFMIVGKPWVMTIQICIQVAAVLLFVPLFAHFYGLIGAAWGFVLSRAVTLPYIYFLMQRAGWLRIRIELQPFIFGAAGVLGGTLLVWLHDLVG
jgi:O-antigen/teichoic acid export membrane protein